MKKIIFSIFIVFLMLSCLKEEEKIGKKQISKIKIVLVDEKKIIEEKEIKLEKSIDKKLDDKKEEKIEKKDEKKEIEDILRVRYVDMIKIKNPDIDLSNINMKKYIVKGENIYFGDNEELVLNIQEYKEIFKAHKGYPSIYNGEKLFPIKREIDRNKKHIVFSFDDGPTDKYHVLIREYFNSINETATFCVTGRNSKRYSNILKETYLSGHEIINHTYNHPNLAKLDDISVLKEVISANNLIYSITSCENDLVRPPYGSFNNKTIKILGGKNKLALWNVDSEDWKNKDKDVIISRVLDKVKDGDIVLFHDLIKETYEAIVYMVPILQERGFQFISYSDMMKLKKERRKANAN